jgi:hypothetical protein
MSKIQYEFSDFFVTAKLVADELKTIDCDERYETQHDHLDCRFCNREITKNIKVEKTIRLYFSKRWITEKINHTDDCLKKPHGLKSALELTCCKQNCPSVSTFNLIVEIPGDEKRQKLFVYKVEGSSDKKNEELLRRDISELFYKKSNLITNRVLT